jgi:hypothetical protein
MPSPSYFPLVVAVGLVTIAYGMILGRTNGSNYLVSVAGVLILLTGLYGWALEPSAAPDSDTHGPEGQPALVGAAAGSGSLGTGGAGALPAGTPAPETAGGSNGSPKADGGPDEGPGSQENATGGEA